MDRRNFLRPAAVAAASSVATGLLHVGRHIADRGFLKPAESSEVGCFRHDRGRFPDVAVGKLTRCPSSLTGRTGFGLRAQMTQRQRRKLLTHELSRGLDRQVVARRTTFNLAPRFRPTSRICGRRPAGRRPSGSARRRLQPR